MSAPPGLLALIVLGLATWRLTSLLADEEGPWGIFCKLRYKVGVRYDVRSEAFGLNVVGKAICCVWCLSIWVGLALTIAYVLAPAPTLWLMVPLALSAFAVGISRMVRHE